MTREEAISNLKMILDEATETEEAVCYVTSDDAEAINMGIKALARGIPQKAIFRRNKRGLYPHCPVCDTVPILHPTVSYCDKCGQAIDWSDEERK